MTTVVTDEHRGEVLTSALDSVAMPVADALAPDVPGDILSRGLRRLGEFFARIAETEDARPKTDPFQSLASFIVRFAGED